MPKSKRSKIISLTKTEKKTKATKDLLISTIKTCIDTYTHIYLFSVENMRNQSLKEIKSEWCDSRFFYGRNKVMAKAFGSSASDAHIDGIHVLSDKLHGDVGLLFTNRLPDEVKTFFSESTTEDYARSGTPSKFTLVIPAGPLNKIQPVEPFPHNMEPLLRKLGLPTRLVNGIVTLDNEFTLAKEGTSLSSDACHLLKLFGVKGSLFRVKVEGYWCSGVWNEENENAMEI